MNKKENNIKKRYSLIPLGKKGISAIVATVLIILITVAAVTIIWAAVIPLISDQLQTGTICLDAIQQVQVSSSGFTCKTPTDLTAIPQVNGEISIQISHGSKDIDLADVSVLVYSEGNSQTLSIVEDAFLSDGITQASSADLPGVNENKVFVITESDLGGTLVSEVDGIAIAPQILVGNTAQTCDSTQIIEIKDC